MKIGGQRNMKTERISNSRVYKASVIKIIINRKHSRIFKLLLLLGKLDKCVLEEKCENKELYSLIFILFSG